MKPLLRFLGIVTALFAVLLIGFSLMLSRTIRNRNRAFRVSVNRINSELNAAAAEGRDPQAVIAERMPDWSAQYGADLPQQPQYLPAQSSSAPFFADSDADSVICSVQDADGLLLGFTVYRVPDNTAKKVRQLTNVLLIACWGAVCAAALYLYLRILAPFRRLSEYPVRIAKLRTAEKLPETKDRYFGNYVWGMNMLNDVMQTDSRRIAQMESQRQAMLASIAHGVKTPVTNIRLYAEALGTGLYSDHGPESKEIAAKITDNADRIEALTAEMIEAAAAAVSAYQPEIEPFYLRELADLTRREFSGQMQLSRVPFTVTCSGNPLIRSDKYGLFRIISQLIGNARKYGDGTGISAAMMRQDDGFCISVRNRGALLPENELPFVFGSFWRGSNAKETEGSGIGLYVSQKIAAALGGRIFARRLPESGEMEFSVFIDTL